MHMHRAGGLWTFWSKLGGDRSCSQNGSRSFNLSDTVDKLDQMKLLLAQEELIYMCEILHIKTSYIYNYILSVRGKEQQKVSEIPPSVPTYHTDDI